MKKSKSFFSLCFRPEKGRKTFSRCGVSIKQFCHNFCPFNKEALFDFIAIARSSRSPIITIAITIITIN
jgi:NADPH-dependent glutamate synthase beta subunit-like oxidoreductase